MITKSKAGSRACSRRDGFLRRRLRAVKYLPFAGAALAFCEQEKSDGKLKFSP